MDAERRKEWDQWNVWRRAEKVREGQINTLRAEDSFSGHWQFTFCLLFLLLAEVFHCMLPASLPSPCNIWGVLERWDLGVLWYRPCMVQRAIGKSCLYLRAYVCSQGRSFSIISAPIRLWNGQLSVMSENMAILSLKITEPQFNKWLWTTRSMNWTH